MADVAQNNGSAGQSTNADGESGGGGNGNVVVREMEYVTGWRFVAVGIAIVLSMFLVCPV